MKRNIISFCAIALVGVSIGALGLPNHSSSTKQANSATKVEKHKSQKQSHKKKANKEKPSADNKSTDGTKKESQQNENVVAKQNNKNSVNTTQTQKQSTQVQPQQQKNQGQINKERGYDPNGHPLLPGQDHAAGSNADGSADDWVKGQGEWLRQNGLINSDGSPTQKEKDIQAQTAAEASNSDINP